VTAPRLAAARLIRLNRRARTSGKAGILLLALSGLIALFWVEARVAPPLTWLRLHGPLCAGIAAVAVAVLIARRRALTRAEFARSWLAAVPVSPSTARWESLLIETLPAIAAMVLLGIGCLTYALILFMAKSAEIFALFAVWGYLSGGVALGVLGSFLVPQPKPVEIPPGSRYVPQHKLRGAAKIRPSLSSLGGWPIRQAFAWAQPKIVARTTIPILVMMPLGTTADTAMVAIALFGIVCALLLVCSAVVSASRLARRWLAPLPLRSADVIRAFLLPICSVIVAAGAIEAALLLVFNVSYRTSAEVGACTALVGCLAASAGLIWNWSLRRLPGRERSHE
jgi:hypothetical protein